MAARIALVQANATVGAVAANADLVMTWSRRAAEAPAAEPAGDQPSEA